MHFSDICDLMEVVDYILDKETFTGVCILKTSFSFSLWEEMFCYLLRCYISKADIIYNHQEQRKYMNVLS